MNNYFGGVDMKDNRYYTTGEFAGKAGVTLRTIRYYDVKGILKPSYYNEAGYRFYSDEDFVKLKKILALKYLGLSLDEIEAMDKDEFEKNHLENYLKLQKTIINNKMNNMRVVLNAIEMAQVSMENNGQELLSVIDDIKSLESEKELLQRIQDVSSLNESVNLMERFSNNTEGWYRWVFKNIDFVSGNNILELACGNGALWVKNSDCILNDTNIILTEIFENMINEAKINLNDSSGRFKFMLANLNKLPFEDNSFDIVIANHILFFMKDLDEVLSEIKRVLKPGGCVYCSTIGESNMKELDKLMHSFSSNIVLHEDKLYSKFGLENGEEILQRYFGQVERRLYNDELIVNDTNGILEYIYSIPGNILEIIDTKKKEFERYIKQSVEEEGPIYLTNSLGIFRATKL